MTLLVFEAEQKGAAAAGGGLLDPARRVAAAEEANAAILKAQQQDSGAWCLCWMGWVELQCVARKGPRLMDHPPPPKTEPVLPALIRLLLRTEEEVRECGVPAGGDGNDGLAATVAWFRS